MRCNFHYLKCKVKVSFKAGGVADHNDPLAAAVCYKIPCHLLLGGMRHKGICAGEIGEDDVSAAPQTFSPCGGNGLARPVARVLVHTREGVENGGFAHVRVACKSDAHLFFCPLGAVISAQSIKSFQILFKFVFIIILYCCADLYYAEKSL